MSAPVVIISVYSRARGLTRRRKYRQWRSVQSLIGGTHSRCEESSIWLMVFDVRPRPRLSERVIILSSCARWRRTTRVMPTKLRSGSIGYLTEVALLLLLATLWGASYSFIKVGVESIPPITFIAARTAIAAVVLLTVLRARRLAMPTDLSLWRRFLFQACLNSVFPFTLIAWAERFVDAGLATILNSSAPIFAFILTWFLAS